MTVKNALPLVAKLQIARIARILDHAGYCPLNFLSDLRCSQSLLQIYYVDFGFDLGMPKILFRSSIALQQMQNVFSSDKDYHAMVEEYRDHSLA